MKAKEIWVAQAAGADTYADFVDCFPWDGVSPVELRIRADSALTVWCGGEAVPCSAYPDYPHYRVAECVDITRFCRRGENRLAVSVWYFGLGCSTYAIGSPSLWYEVRSGERVLAVSGENTRGRKSRTYAHGAGKFITSQLGLSFAYDAEGEDAWRVSEVPGFSPCAIVGEYTPERFRPIKACEILPLVPGKLIKKENHTLLFDLGREEVGYLSLAVTASSAQTLRISFGEHIEDGGVRRVIGARDFSVSVRVGKGSVEYDNRFRRLGCRYLEVEAEDATALSVDTIGLLPVLYPLDEIPFALSDPLDRAIWGVCVRTLRLCMHDHYEDCPWREQALYALDSRNQMLCGYYAFKEYAFPRSCLTLIAQGKRKDGLLPITAPSSSELAIPSFSLFWIIGTAEYIEHSGDASLGRELWGRLGEVLSVFSRRAVGDLIPVFTDRTQWNFYEWTADMAGHCAEATEPYRADGLDLFESAMNALYVLALRAMARIAQAIGEDPSDFLLRAERTARAADALFYDTERGLYVNRAGERNFSELSNAMMILAGAPSAGRAEKIGERLAAGDGMTEVSLSMLGFKYDALLTLGDSYRGYVLEDIRKVFRPMLEAGATSVWETRLGASDFDGAGSLCHGWSAMPIVYYHRILGAKVNNS